MARPPKAALGFRTHSGWACAILATGQDKKIEIIDRRRILLHDLEIPGTKQPFHAVEPMPLAKAENYITRCKTATDRLAGAAMTSFKQVAQSRGILLSGVCVITASGCTLPGLEDILASHALIHAAEGEFYRAALIDAADAMGIPIMRLNAKTAPTQTAALLGVGEQMLAERLREIGAQIGRPWTADEKLATMAAWSMLAKLASATVRPLSPS
jgi:hypothetical protein